MAAITSANVTLVSAYEVASKAGVTIEHISIYDVVLSSQGGTAGDIPASAFGYATFNWAECVRAIDGSSALSTVFVILETSGTSLQIADPENATDNTRGNVADYTGTVRIRFGGRRL